jgi:GNAT superfamily N-acetyltransferase
MSIFCRKASPEEVAPLHQIIKRCGEDMFQRFGLCHWHPVFPVETMRKDAMAKSIYGVYREDLLAGCFTVGTSGWKYPPDLWERPGDRALYLSKAAILPELQNQGLGKWCVEKVEQLARESGCSAVRLSAITDHALLLRFFERLGYGARGSLWIKDWRGVSREITVFEKAVAASRVSAEPPVLDRAVMAAPSA